MKVTILFESGKEITYNAVEKIKYCDDYIHIDEYTFGLIDVYDLEIQA